MIADSGFSLLVWGPTPGGGGMGQLAHSPLVEVEAMAPSPGVGCQAKVLHAMHGLKCGTMGVPTVSANWYGFGLPLNLSYRIAGWRPSLSHRKGSVND